MHFAPKSNGRVAISWRPDDGFTHEYSGAVLMRMIREGRRNRQSLLAHLRKTAVPITAATLAGAPGRFFPNDFRAMLGSPRLLDQPGQPLGIQLKCLGDDFVYDSGELGLIPGQTGSVGEVELLSLMLGWEKATADELSTRNVHPGRFLFAYGVGYELGHNGAFLSPPTPVPPAFFASASGIKSSPMSLGIGPVWFVPEDDEGAVPADWTISVALFDAFPDSEASWTSHSTIGNEYFGHERKDRTVSEYVQAAGGIFNAHFRRGCVIATGNAGANDGVAAAQQLWPGKRAVCEISGIGALTIGFSHLHSSLEFA